jgi:D-arginine dehydrogenase
VSLEDVAELGIGEREASRQGARREADGVGLRAEPNRTAEHRTSLPGRARARGRSPQPHLDGAGAAADAAHEAGEHRHTRFGAVTALRSIAAGAEPQLRDRPVADDRRREDVGEQRVVREEAVERFARGRCAERGRQHEVGDRQPRRPRAETDAEERIGGRLGEPVEERREATAVDARVLGDVVEAGRTERGRRVDSVPLRITQREPQQLRRHRAPVARLALPSTLAPVPSHRDPVLAGRAGGKRAATCTSADASGRARSRGPVGGPRRPRGLHCVFMADRREFEVVIVGSGIAGASLAYFLAERGLTDVLLLEREAQPGHHATGRSAATLVEWDPIPILQALKVQGGAFLRHPPPGFCEHPLLDPHGILVTFQEPLWSGVRAALGGMAERGTTLRELSRAEVLDRMPVLVPEHVDGGVLLPEDGHIDVHGLLWGYLGRASRRGVRRRCGVEVHDVRVEGGRVRGVVTSAGEFGARWVVDAAGAWAGPIAALAGAAPIPLTPLRRTIVAFAVPDGIDTRGWPLVSNESHRLYFGPESGGVFACPMDEEPMPPCDARPDEVVVAEAIEKIRTLAPPLAPTTLRRTWAGLRTFAPDRVLVVGEDPRVAGFFWLAGQGGCGIETSGAVGQIAADLIVSGRTERLDAARLSPARFASG